MKVTARRARKLRARIAANRCPVRPGITHQWITETLMDPMSAGAVVDVSECVKCHKNAAS